MSAIHVAGLADDLSCDPFAGPSYEVNTPYSSPSAASIVGIPPPHWMKLLRTAGLAPSTHRAYQSTNRNPLTDSFPHFVGTFRALILSLCPSLFCAILLPFLQEKAWHLY